MLPQCVHSDSLFPCIVATCAPLDDGHGWKPVEETKAEKEEKTEERKTEEIKTEEMKTDEENTDEEKKTDGQKQVTSTTADSHINRSSLHMFLKLALISVSLIFLCLFFAKDYYIPPQDMPKHMTSDVDTFPEYTRVIYTTHCKSLPHPYTFPDQPNTLPLIDAQAYTTRLASHACTYPSGVLVVVGPKSSGKSYGLSGMRTAWRNQGRLVPYLELDGVVGSSTFFLCNNLGSCVSLCCSSVVVPLTHTHTLTHLKQSRSLRIVKQTL